MENDDEFYDELQEFFLIETHERLEKIEQSFLDLEHNLDNSETNKIINTIFGFCHDVKGSSKSIGFHALSHLAHHLETILVSIKNKEIPLSEEIASLLLSSNDRIKDNLRQLTQDKKAEINNDDFIGQLNAYIQKSESVELSEAHDKEDKCQNEDETITETVDVLDEERPLGEILVDDHKVSPEDIERAAKYQQSKIGEILVDQGKIDSQILNDSLSKQKKSSQKSDEYIRISLSKIDEMVNYFGEQVILQSTLEYAKDNIDTNKDLMIKTITQLSKITHDLQQTAISLRMVSIKTLFSKLERVSRDCSKETGKQIVFHKSGEECELDKNILEGITDPLIHMIRNAVDHGIESSDDRMKQDKTPEGNIWLRAYPRSGYFYIEIQDDGQGLNKEKILQSALESKLIKDTNISDSAAWELIFRTGLSTRNEATELSGRGIGMNIVKNAIEKLKGTCTIESLAGKGTLFTIRLPQTLAIFNGMIIMVNGFRYIIANSDVIEVIPYVPSAIRRINENAVLDVKGDVIELIDLCQFLKVNSDEKDPEHLDPTILIVTHKNMKYGFKIDGIIAQQRIVYKAVGTEIKKVKGITGGTILGDGRVALILSPGELLANLH